jgi:hypothetical protein
MRSSVGFALTDVSEEGISSIFRVEKSSSEEGDMLIWNVG